MDWIANFTAPPWLKEVAPVVAITALVVALSGLMVALYSAAVATLNWRAGKDRGAVADIEKQLADPADCAAMVVEFRHAAARVASSAAGSRK